MTGTPRTGTHPEEIEVSHDGVGVHRRLYVARALSVLAVAIVSLRFAWLSDDALITVRTALNALHDYGFVFNIDEHVAGYTHPLWLALLTSVGWMTGDVILAPMIMGVLLTGVAWTVVVTHVQSVQRLVLGTVALLLANSFIEYSSAGLENPLAYALVAGLIVLGVRGPVTTPLVSMAFGLLIAALLLTRLDFILLIGPVILVTMWSMRRSLRLFSILLASCAIPLIVWAVLTMGFYGFLLPSTFSAKTNSSIPRLELITSGINYLFVTFANDPVSLIIIAVGLACAVAIADLQLRMWLLGVVLYLGYITWVGGDFMAGRFVAVPVFVVVASLVLAPRGAFTPVLPRTATGPTTFTVVAAACAVLLVSGWGRSIVLTPQPLEGQRWDYGRAGGVADERGYYLAMGRGLQQYLGAPRPPEQSFIDVRNPPESWRPDIAQLMASARAWSPDSPTRTVEVTCGGLGGWSIVTGPHVHWIDPCGLTDRFLASLPYEARDFRWRVGHFDRPIPEGYIEAVQDGDPGRLQDPQLRWRLEYVWRYVRP